MSLHTRASAKGLIGIVKWLDTFDAPEETDPIMKRSWVVVNTKTAVINASNWRPRSLIHLSSKKKK